MSHYTILLQAKRGGRRLLTRRLETVQDLSRAYLAERTACGEGPDTFMLGAVFGPKGTRTYVIDYEGRVWDVRECWRDNNDEVALARTRGDPGTCLYDPKT